MYDLTLINHNGGAYIDSREVAKLVGKRHDHLIRDIRGYRKILEKSDLPNVGDVRFFIESSYIDIKGEVRPCYLLSKMGCELVSNKLTGEKGTIFTAIYVSKFNELERAKLAEQRAKSKISHPPIGDYNEAAKIIVNSLKNMGATSEQILKFLKKLYEPIGITVADENEFIDIPKFYTAKQIAKSLGVYSIYGKPHFQAISCIISENSLVSEKDKFILTSDYGDSINISVRYSIKALSAVSEWLVDNRCPTQIHGFCRTYYVTYISKLVKEQTK